MAYSPLGRQESDLTERFHFTSWVAVIILQFINESNQHGVHLKIIICFMQITS